ncbi:MAG TPA: hypothetical protein ENN23_07780 [Deltaproteobacteria bacterium]|nr:hypothetical protein [Deltaproteobacteria bacterium]
MEIKNERRLKYYSFVFAVVALAVLIACGGRVGHVVISEPDEYRVVYEANEEVILRAIAGVFWEKRMGTNVTIRKEDNYVKTDYIVQGDWRTKSLAKVRKLNWKESEVLLSVITEKKTKSGWEMRRLLDKQQYLNLFGTIELRIYEEMAKRK